MVKNIIKDESGQGLAEYALILALIAVVVIAALTGIGTSVRDKLNQVGTSLGGSSSSSGT